MAESEIAYQSNVAGILRNAQGQILICERAQVDGAWQFPQGGVDKGETLEKALRRELWEEISVVPEDYRIAESRGPYHYLFGGGRRKKGHHGKMQQYFLCEFHASDARINVETEHPEFQAWKWIAPSDFQLAWLPEMKVGVYREVFRDFFGITL